MKFKFLTVIFAGAAILLSSCSDENQSKLEIESIKGRATIEGKVLYNSGDMSDGEGGIKYDQFSPIADKTVYFNLDLSSLGEYDGKLVYTTQTSNDGTFLIEIPANLKGISYTVHVESFKASKSEYNSTTSSFIPKNHYFSNIDVASLTAFENIGDYKEIRLDNSTEIQ